VLEKDVKTALSGLAPIFRNRRHELGLTAAELSEVSGVSERQILCLEVGENVRNAPTFTTIWKLCNALGLHVSISISGPSVVAAVSQVIPELATMSDGRTEALDTALRAVAEAFIQAVKDSEVRK